MGGRHRGRGVDDQGGRGVTISIRLRVRANGDRTLQGYVFSNREHARAWLTQAWVKPADYTLEVVEVDDLCRCAKCDGTGFSQTVKVTGTTTIEDFLTSGVP